MILFVYLCSIPLLGINSVILIMSKREYRTIFFYEFTLGRSGAQTARNINQVWGEGSVNECTVQRWFKKFREGDFSLEDEEGRGRPSSLNDDVLQSVVEENPKTTVRELAEQLKVSKTTVSNHLKAIGKVKKLENWVPHSLNDRQKNQRFDVCASLLCRNKNDPFLARIVTCDEKWILYDNTRRSGQWLDKGEAPKHFPKPPTHQKKVMVTVWWASFGLIHYSFLNPGETINAESYCNQINTMHQKLAVMNPSLVNRKGPILLHDNARPHVSRVTSQKLLELGYETLPHPPYSPDLSPTDYHFFRHLDLYLQHKIFKNQTELENAFFDFINSKKSEFYSDGINKLPTRWEKCVESMGNYFD